MTRADSVCVHKAAQALYPWCWYWWPLQWQHDLQKCTPCWPSRCPRLIHRAFAPATLFSCVCVQESTPWYPLLAWREQQIFRCCDWSCKQRCWTCVWPCSATPRVADCEGRSSVEWILWQGSLQSFCCSARVRKLREAFPWCVAAARAAHRAAAEPRAAPNWVNVGGVPMSSSLPELDRAAQFADVRDSVHRLRVARATRPEIPWRQ